MAHVNRVIRSFNHKGSPLCIGIYKRPDGSFGYEEFRRDFEYPRGWFAVGHFGARVFTSAEEVLTDARQQIGRMDQALSP